MAHGNEIDFAGVRARYVVITAKTIDGNWGDIWNYYELSEVRFHLSSLYAANPAIADTAKDVPLDAVLSWDSGFPSAWHDVYFGTNFDLIRSDAISFADVQILAWQWLEDGLVGGDNNGDDKVNLADFAGLADKWKEHAAFKVNIDSITRNRLELFS